MLILMENGDEFSLPISMIRIENNIINKVVAKYSGHQTKVALMLDLTDRVIRRLLNKL